MVRDLAAEISAQESADRNRTDRFVAISGCSGGGKSTLLDALARPGFPTVEEPGRRIVAEELLGSGSALPWIDLAAFARRAIALALKDRARMGATSGWVFFDRGLVDAAAALRHATGEPVVDALGWRIATIAASSSRRHGRRSIGKMRREGMIKRRQSPNMIDCAHPTPDSVTNP